MPTINVENGNNSRDSLPNVDGADEPNTAVKSVKKVRGYFTVIGVSRPIPKSFRSKEQNAGKITSSIILSCHDNVFMNV